MNSADSFFEELPIYNEGQKRRSLDSYLLFLGRQIDIELHPTRYTALAFDELGRSLLGASSPHPFSTEDLQLLCESTAEATHAEAYEKHVSPRRLPIFGERAIDHAKREALTDPEFSRWMWRGSALLNRKELFWYLDNYENPLAMAIEDCDRAFNEARKTAEEIAEDDDDTDELDEYEAMLREYSMLRDAWLTRRVAALATRSSLTPGELEHVCNDIQDLEPPEHGGVYALQGSGDFIKIGKASKSIRQRVRDIQVAHPVRLRLLAVLSTDPNDEVKLHKRFAHLRAEGEWFSPGTELLGLIRSVRGLA